MKRKIDNSVPFGYRMYVNLKKNLKLDYFFNKVILLNQVGAFYESYDESAITLIKDMDLNRISTSSVPKVGFPTNALTKYASKIVSKGHLIVVQSQTGTECGKKTRKISHFYTYSSLYNTPVMAVVSEKSENYNVCIYLPCENKSIQLKCNISGICNLTLQHGIREILVHEHSDVSLKLKRKLQSNIVIFLHKMGINCPKSMINAFVFPTFLYSTESERHFALDTLKFEVGDLNDILFINQDTRVSLRIIPSILEQQTFINTINKAKTKAGRRYFEKLLLNPLSNKTLLQGRLKYFQTLSESKYDELYCLLPSKSDITPTVTALFKIEQVYETHASITKCTTLLQSLNAELLQILKWFTIKEKYVRVQNMNMNKYEYLYKITNVDTLNYDSINEIIKPLYNEYLIQVQSQMNVPVRYDSSHDLVSDIKYFKSISKIPFIMVKKRSKASITFTFVKLMNIKSKEAYLQAEVRRKYVKKLNSTLNDVKTVACSVFKLAETFALDDVYVSYLHYYGNKISIPTFEDTEQCVKELTFPITADSFYVPNTLYFHNHAIKVISGCNGAGKSTLMRLFALNVLLAQSGFGVFCKQYNLPIKTTLHACFGISDDILNGKSSFEVECERMKTILNHSDSNTVVILDEPMTTCDVTSSTKLQNYIMSLLNKKKVLCLTSTHSDLTKTEYLEKLYMPSKGFTLTNDVLPNRKSIFDICKEISGMPKNVYI